jgi:S-DNA-T family DNA segregation ATPase FtsK/SpoIIIE
VKIQNAFITQSDAIALASWCGSNSRQPEVSSRLGPNDLRFPSGGLDEPRELGKADPFFQQAIEIVLNEGEGSTSLLQRRLKIGYARAAALIDALAGKGILGPPSGAQPRRLLVQAQQQVHATRNGPDQSSVTLTRKSSDASNKPDTLLSLVAKLFRAR